MACAAPQVMISQFLWCACRVCITGEKFVRTDSEITFRWSCRVYLLLHYTEVHWCAGVGDLQLQLSISHAQHQHLTLFSLLFSGCWKCEFECMLKNHIRSSLRQEWVEMLPYKWAVALHQREKQPPYLGGEKIKEVKNVRLTKKELSQQFHNYCW